MKVFFIDGYEFFVGKNSSENWDLVKRASQKDIWFHLAHKSSASGILVNGVEATLKTLRKVAREFCALFPNKNCTKVIYTGAKKVSFGPVPGTFIVDNFKEL